MKIIEYEINALAVDFFFDEGHSASLS